MKLIRFKLGAALATLSLWLGSPFYVSAQMSTAFTYQGRLMDAGTPANGLYDFKFTLYDALLDGSPVGNPAAPLAAVPVTNGLFTVTLDFGLPVFNGADRWLQISVKTNGGGLYALLSPRQPLTPTPYALFAANAGKAAFASSVPWAAITGIPADFADGVDNDTTYSAGSGLSLSGANAFKVNFGGSGLLESAARSDHDHFGANWIGNLPGAPGLGVWNSGVNGTAIHGQADATTGTGNGVQGTSAAENGFGVAGYGDGTGPSHAGVSGQSSSGGYGVSGYADGTSGEGVYGSHGAATGTGSGVHGVTESAGASAVGVLGEVASPAPGFLSAAVRGLNRGTGIEGIGVWGSHEGSGYGVYGHAPAGTGVAGASESGTGVEGRATAARGDGVFGYAAGVQGTGVFGYASDGSGVGVWAAGSGTSGTALAVDSGAIRVVGASANTATPVFIQHVTADTRDHGIGNSATFIDNPYCNGKPNVMLLVTYRAAGSLMGAGGLRNNHHYCAFYDTDHQAWAIFNQDGVAIPDNAEFSVIVVTP